MYCASVTHTLYEHINTRTHTPNYLRIRTHSHEMKIIANRKKRANTLCLRSTRYLFTVSSAIKRFCFVFTLCIYVRDFDSNGFLFFFFISCVWNGHSHIDTYHWLKLNSYAIRRNFRYFFILRFCVLSFILPFRMIFSSSRIEIKTKVGETVMNWIELHISEFESVLNCLWNWSVRNIRKIVSITLFARQRKRNLCSRECLVIKWWNRQTKTEWMGERVQWPMCVRL